MQTRQIVFDGGHWKSASRSSQIDIRYRMVNDLMQRLENMEMPTLEPIHKMLGPPDLGRPESRVLGYYLGRKHFGPSRLNGYFLRLSFDENHKLVDVIVVPE